MGYRIFRGFCFAVVAVVLIIGTRWLLGRLATGFGLGGPTYDISAEAVSVFVGCWVVWRYGDIVWPLSSKHAARPGRSRRQGQL